jgi:glycosyltransferase involved in cell wall biosynthesis
MPTRQNSPTEPMSACSNEPAVSVIVPCRNEKDHIENCVLSILAQHAPAGGFEVIVADGLSDDGTREVLEKLASLDDRVRIIDNLERTTAHGMNAGIREARGRYIAIMGAHNEYARDYLRTSLEVLQTTGADNVGGSMICRGESRLQHAIAAAHHSPFSVGGARWHDTGYEGPADTVFGGFYRREVFERIGLFDESLIRNQDDELNLRLTRTGGKIWHSPKIKSWYRPRTNLTALFRQYLQYGYWKVRVMQKHRRPASVRHLVPGAFLLAVAVLPFLSPLYPLILLLWLGVLGSYVICNLIASLVTARRHGWECLASLPLVFTCYHVGYGLGFVRGVLDFIILRRVPSNVFHSLTRSTTTKRID